MISNLNTITWVTQWFKYISIIRYTLEGTTVSEYLNLQQQDDTFYVNGTQYVCNYAQKTSFVSQWLVIDEMSYGTWAKDFGISCAICIFFLILTYVGLARSTKIKQ